MALSYEEPQERPDLTSSEGTVYTHPAFAQISASRVSGGAHLYGSDFQHQYYITVTIRASKLHRSLSRDQHFGRNELIEVAMSEAQWATFISTLNVGSGTPCTLQHDHCTPVPQLPPPRKLSEKFSRDMRETVAEIQQDLKKVAAELTTGTIGKTRAKELQQTLERLSARLTSSTGFVADSFDEHMEATIEKAKVEVNSYVSNVVTRAGLEAIAQQATPLYLTFQDDTPLSDT